MRWIYDFAPNKKQQQQHGWNTTSNEYLSHIANIERMPSVLNEVPHYPDVHKAFNNKYTYGDQEQESTRSQQVVQQPKKSSPKAKAKKKVQVTERVEIVSSSNKDDDDDDDDKNSEARKDSIDIQAAGFIQKKHKGFELCKWKTFKLY